MNFWIELNYTFESKWIFELNWFMNLNRNEFLNWIESWIWIEMNFWIESKYGFELNWIFELNFKIHVNLPITGSKRLENRQKWVRNGQKTSKWTRPRKRKRKKDAILSQNMQFFKKIQLNFDSIHEFSWIWVNFELNLNWIGF